MKGPLSGKGQIITGKGGNWLHGTAMEERGGCLLIFKKTEKKEE